MFVCYICTITCKQFFQFQQIMWQNCKIISSLYVEATTVNIFKMNLLYENKIMNINLHNLLNDLYNIFNLTHLEFIGKF